MKELFTKADCQVKWVLTEHGEFPADFSETSQQIVKAQYFRGGETSFWSVINRVVGGIMQAPRMKVLHGNFREETARRLCYGLAHQHFAFNSPVFYNVGVTKDPQCSACFIQSVEDNMGSIMDLAKKEAMIFKQGSGTGTNLSPLRASTESLSGSDGFASGPVSFMRGFDAFAGVIKSGGRTRRAAKMTLLDDDHPDLLEFVTAKAAEDRKAKLLIKGGMGPEAAYASVSLQNMNTSVRVSDDFMEEAQSGDIWAWGHRPRNKDGGFEEGKISASEILREIASAAWECGDPGLQFASTIEEENMVPGKPIRASNPCSEFLFMDESACNLASINVMKFTGDDGVIDYNSLSDAAMLLTRAMDAIVDMSGYPTPKIRENSVKYRPLGLGLSNIGATLMKCGYRYGSDDANAMVKSWGDVLFSSAMEESAEIARVFGAYPGWGSDALRILDHKTSNAVPLSVRDHGLANAQLTLMAPTGTISFMMGCESTGIEPVFAVEQSKRLASGETITIVPECVATARAIGKPGAVVTAIGENTVSVEDHLSTMAALQPYLSGGISKTVNLPSTATVDDIVEVYIDAWERGLKSIAVYRDGSKSFQPLREKASRATLPALLRKAADDYFSTHTGFGPHDRERLPDERPAKTHKFTVGGMDGYVTVGLYEDGRPGEVFVKIAKEGSTASGFMDAWATVLSIYLQHGLPLSKIIEKGSGQKFEPSGFTSNPDLPSCTSLVDYILRWMERTFEDEEMAEPPNLSDGGPPDSGGGTPGSTQVPADWDGNTCPRCGSAVQPTGTCYTCVSCGWNGGCG